MRKKPQEINEFISRNIDPDVQAIIRNGMYVMLDIHMYPDPEGVRTARTLVQFARDYYLPVMLQLAKKYKDEPMIAVYELWNEPYPADIEAPPPEDTEGDWANQLRSYFIDAVNEMRKIDTRHVIMVSDHNAGWGCATPELWGGYYKKLDPVYQNTAYSIHAGHEQLDKSFAFYSNWWKNLAVCNNLCLIFGEIETEGDLATEKGMQNLFNFFSETEKECHFSGVLWRPHGHGVEYQHLWDKNSTGWADNYCNKGPFPAARYVIEAEDQLDNEFSNIVLTKDPNLFGVQRNGTGISLKPNSKPEYFNESTTEVIENIIYKNGKYKLIVRAAGKKGYAGDFIVGYKDMDGVVHQIARFLGKDTSMQPYHQTVEFTAEKRIVSFVFFSCESKTNSAFIDRVYIEGKAASDQITDRYMYTIPNAQKVVFLDGKTANVNVEPPKVFEYSPDEEEDKKPTASDTETEIDTDTNTNNNNDKNKDDKDKENTNSNVIIQIENDDDEEIVENVGTKTTQKEDSTFTPILLIILIGVLVVWVASIVGFIIFKKKKSKATETEN